MKKNENYRKMIGDGKLPNKYWVFEYDEKFRRVKADDGTITTEIIAEDKSKFNHLIGEYETYAAARRAVDEMGTYPHIVIEDRLSGTVFERICIRCQECGGEDWEDLDDIKFTKRTMERMGEEFL